MFWNFCREKLREELTKDQFDTWIRPVKAVEAENSILLIVPNRFVLNSLKEHYLPKIREIAHREGRPEISVEANIGGRLPETNGGERTNAPPRADPAPSISKYNSKLRPDYTFDTFVEGSTNRFAKTAALQVAKKQEPDHIPLLICGGVGLGKTHLMQAIGHESIRRQPGTQIAYLHSERFVAQMVQALQHNTIDRFKRHYRSLDTLLIDDIQFFAGKEQSQEEFFHTFNALLESQSRIVLTCDRYPKEVPGLEERLKSRFGSGLTVTIDPPELETRVAILKSKAQQKRSEVPDETCFFIAKRFRSANVRELEGALNRVIANAKFTNAPITLDFAKEALKDMLALIDRQVSLGNIQKTTAEYFNIRISDLLSKRRSRSITRPRQIAMTIAKELTNHSLPEIGEAFGGRDHTTVIHACRKISELRQSDNKIEEDYKNIMKILSI